MAGGDRACRGLLRVDEGFPQGRGLRDDLADSACLGGGPGERCGGARGEGSGELVQFLRIAQGSLKELETHLLLASRVGLTTEKEVQPVLEKCEKIGKMLRALIRSIQKRQVVRSRAERVGGIFPTPHSLLPKVLFRHEPVAG